MPGDTHRVALPDLTREFLLVFSSVRTRSRSVLPAFPCNVDVCKRKDPGIVEVAALTASDAIFLWKTHNGTPPSLIRYTLHQDCLNSVDDPGVC